MQLVEGSACSEKPCGIGTESTPPAGSSKYYETPLKGYQAPPTPHPTPTAQVMQTLDFVLLKCLEPFWMDHYPEPTAAQCKQKWLWSGLTQAQ